MPCTTPGAGQAINYYVGPQDDGRVELSSGKPTVAEVRAGWHPEPVSVRFHGREGHSLPKGRGGFYMVLPPTPSCAVPFSAFGR